MIKKIFLFTAIAFVVVTGVRDTEAATFGLFAENQDFSVGDDLVVELDIDSQGVSINAAQGTVRFSPDVLEARSADRSQTVFNFWLQEPVIDNEAGTIIFTGGSTSGFSGASLELFKINFRVKGLGASTISVADGAITASDGSGTNVLVGTRGIDIISGAEVGLPSTQVTITPPVIPPVTQITRPAVTAAALPVEPDVTIRLYPDEVSWYNVSSPFLARWPLPSDVSAVATSLDKNPASEPPASEGLFDNKTFAALDDGIWYLHVQFKNSVGWGPVAHYRIAVDTLPPVPFEVSFSGGLSSTNPSPVVSFEASDPLSGLVGYAVQVGTGDYKPIERGSFTLPVLAPGKHIVRVVAKDRAGNSTENTSELEVLPIESPVINYFTRKVYVGEGGLEIRGMGIPGYSVTVSIIDSQDTRIISTIIPVDIAGGWFVKLDEPLKRGNYHAEVTAKDERGALSLPVRSGDFSASAKPIITIVGIGITPSFLFVIVVLILIGGFAAGWLTEKNIGMQRQRKIILAKRDIKNVLAVIKKDIQTAVGVVEKSEVKLPPEVRYYLDKAEKNIDKMGKYLVEGIEEINHRK